MRSLGAISGRGFERGEQRCECGPSQRTAASHFLEAIMHLTRFRPNNSAYPVLKLFLNRYPLIPGAGIGDGLDDAHVVEAVFEIGVGTVATFGLHRGDEIFFDSPFAR